MNHWLLKKGSDFRLRSKHPWVFANELTKSVQGIAAGSPVVVTDFKGEFLAYGYGHPSSFISFRALSYDEKDRHFLEKEFLMKRVQDAALKRMHLGLRESCRLVFSEADEIPGVILDFFTLNSQAQEAEPNAQVFVFQINTAGMDRFFKPHVLLIAEQCLAEMKKKNSKTLDWSRTAVLMKNESSFRKLEGLEIEKPVVLKSVEGVDLKDASLRIFSNQLNRVISFRCNLIDGQKTGFFLDQTANIEQVVERILMGSWSGPTVRQLDLCSYVGSWSARLAQAFLRRGFGVESTLIDASKLALDFAILNVPGKVEVVQGDVLECLGSMPDQSYDVVVADPPAFVKNKKDLPQGQHGYMKLFTQSLRLTKPGGLMVACSCSGLFTEVMMLDSIRKAAHRSGRKVQVIGRGGQPVDHPTTPAFTEGSYLKMFILLVD